MGGGEYGREHASPHLSTCARFRRLGFHHSHGVDTKGAHGLAHSACRRVVPVSAGVGEEKKISGGQAVTKAVRMYTTVCNQRKLRPDCLFVYSSNSVRDIHGR